MVVTGSYFVATCGNRSLSEQRPNSEIGLADAKVMSGWANTYKDQIYVMLPLGENSWWRDVRNSAVIVVIQVVLAVFAFATSTLAFAKLVGYVRARGFKLHLPHVLLMSEFLTNLWRAVYFAIDPIYLGRWFAGPASHGLSTFTWSISTRRSYIYGRYKGQNDHLADVLFLACSNH
jgi:hypothetical protein